jgi:RNA polymerase sigma factor FliA
MVSKNVNGADRQARGLRRARGSDVVMPALPGTDGASAEDARSQADAGSQAVAGAAAGGGEELTEDLLRRYRLRGSTALRDQVVERHREIVESMARGLAQRLPPSVDAQDLVHAGMWGLMQAVASYEPARCDQFSAFMRIRVRGAMLDELRHMDFLSRLFRRRLRERAEAVARLRSVLEREPSDAELAAELGISETALWQRYESWAGRSMASGDGADGDRMEQLTDDELESPIEAITRQELLQIIRQSLGPIEWKVLQLHYLEGMTGKQVARRMRLSASRICQIHGQVLDRLKVQLAGAAAV